MIKARLMLSAGTPLIVLGLSGENVTRLMADEPIVFELSEVGLGPGKLLIIGGRTEQEITEQLEYGRLLPKGTGEAIRKTQR